MTWLVETHQIKRKDSKAMDELCFKTKNLYNAVNYDYRQLFFGNKKRKENGEATIPFPHHFALTAKYVREKQPDYKALPSGIAQAVVAKTKASWTLFFTLSKDWKKNPHKYNSYPDIPKYKDKIKGRYWAIFTKGLAKIKNGYVCFPKATKIQPIKTRVTKENFCQAQIIPCGNSYKVLVMYKVEAKDVGLDKKRVLGIDLGVNNLATIVDNTGERRPIVIKGGRIKSENQWWNKNMAELKACLPNGKGSTRKTQLISLRRTNRVNDALHKTSHFIIDYCLKNNIGTIVVGKNKGWKKESKLSSFVNQKFVEIPHARLIDQINYKSQLYCMAFIEQEESHTSKCDALALEPVEHREFYLGKRKHRGLFVSSTGKHIHADVNGALNIIRKAIGDDNLVLNWGCLAQPVSEVLHA